MRNLVWKLSLAVLILLYGMAVLAPFLAPYPHKEQFREFPSAPPITIHFQTSQGKWQSRPYIQTYERGDRLGAYAETGQWLPILFLVEGSPYSLMGFDSSIHLFGVPAGAPPLFLLGSDELGRDLFSRILYGSQFSLTIGLVGIVFTVLLGVVVGAVSGYFGGWLDTLLMRTADLFLSLPGLFLILGIRAVFPREMAVGELYWLIILIFTLIGWSSIARVIRGQVLSLKTREYVLAARACGASHWRILTRHILPETRNYLLVQSSLLIPAFILGEITLSFLGVGVQEPDASWGNLLIAATSVRKLTAFPWLLFPALFIFVTVLAFNLIGDELKALNRTHQVW